MKYILIWWVWASGVATGSVEFEARQACEDAAQAITQRMGAHPGVQAAIARYDASPNPEGDGTMEAMKAQCGNIFDGN